MWTQWAFCVYSEYWTPALYHKQSKLIGACVQLIGLSFWSEVEWDSCDCYAERIHSQILKEYVIQGIKQ